LTCSISGGCTTKYGFLEQNKLNLIPNYRAETLVAAITEQLADAGALIFHEDVYSPKGLSAAVMAVLTCFNTNKQQKKIATLK
jgi:hypothetical protein